MTHHGLGCLDGPRWVTRMGSQLLLIVGLLAAPQASSAVTLKRFEDSQPHMGTVFHIILYADTQTEADAAFQAAFSRVAQLDRLMSDYDPDSELSQLSKASPTATSKQVSADLFEVLEQAQRISQLSDGAFDVTVGPLTRLWRRARRQKSMPDPTRLDEALAAVGYRHLRLSAADGSVSLLKSGMRLDLGGIAKGYAADEALELLGARGIERALIDSGGDIAVSQPPPGETGWKIGLAPLDAGRPPTEFVRLARTTIATSGDAWQFVEIDGVRYSHIVDPRTGLGVTRRGGVTVLAPTAATSDALASALSVMGVREGIALIQRVPGASARILWRRGGAEHVRCSPGFPVASPQ